MPLRKEKRKKKVVSLVLVVLVATLMSAQVFATSSPSSSDVLVEGPDGLVITVYPGTGSAVEDVLADAKAYAKDAAAFGFKNDEFKVGLIFDASWADGSTGGATFTVNAGLKSGDKVHVMHKVGGEWKEETATVSGSNVTITAASLSPFVVLQTASSSNGTSPATGDMMVAVYGVGAVVFAAAAALLLKKRENA